MRKLSFLAIAALLWAATARPALADDPLAGAYASTFIDVRSSFLDSPTYTTSTGAVLTGDCTFTKAERALYVEQPVEHGNGAITVNVPYDELNCGGQHAAGIADTEIGYERALVHTAYSRFSLSATGIVPGTGSNADPAVSYGQFGAQLGVRETLTYRAFAHYGWIDAAVGARGYTGAPAPRLLASTAVGYAMSRGVSLVERFSMTQSLGAGNAAVTSNPTIATRYDAQQLESGVTVALRPGVSAYISELVVLGGRNYGLGRTFNVAVWLHG